jgi:putative inorganic carbon (HCO3(-)) transporter
MIKRRGIRFSRHFYAIVIVLAMILPAMYITFLGIPPMLFYYPQRTRFHTLAALLIAGWLAWKWIVGQELVRTSIDLPLCAFLVVAALSTFQSIDHRISAESFLSLVLYALIFYLLLDLRRGPLIWTSLIRTALTTAVLVCLWAIAQEVTWHIGLPTGLRQAFWDAPIRSLAARRLSGLGNPNTLAVYLLLVLPLGIQTWISARARWARILVGAGVLVGGATLILTGSRGGILGLGAASALGVWLSLRAWWRKRSRRERAILMTLGGLVVVAGMIVVVQRGLSLAGRGEIWHVALAIARDNPLLGSGPGTFGMELLRYWNPAVRLRIVAAAHNVFLHTAAEMGGLGLVAFLGLAGTLMVNLYRQVQEDGGFPPAAASLIGITGWTVHSMFDTFLDKPVIVLYVILLAAHGLGGNEELRPVPRRARLIGATAIALTLGVTAIGINHAIAAHFAAQTAALRGDWEAASRWVGIAARRDPESWFYSHEKAVAEGVLACQDPTRLPQALSAYQASLRRFDAWSVDHANVASLWFHTGATAQAIEEMADAHTRQPEVPLYACNLGRYLEAAGRLDQAQAAYADCLALDPTAYASPFWEATVWRSGALPQILERAERVASAPSDLVIQAYRGLAIEDLPAPGSPSAQVEVAQALLLAGQEDTAVDQLNQILARSPVGGPPSATAWRLLGQIQLTNEEGEQATQSLQNSIYLEPTAEAYFLLGQAAESLHRSQEAMAHYRAAINHAIAPSISGFASWVAHNLSLPQEHLPCLIAPRPAGELAGPALALGRLLEEEGDCPAAAQTYRLALTEAPYLAIVQERLDALPCTGDDS